MNSFYETIDVRLSGHLAQALWTAMHDDDDLVGDYVELCVIHGLSHLVRDMAAERYTPEAWARIHGYLEIARRNAIEKEEAIADKFNSYGEPPF